MAATRVRFALVALACAFAGVAVIVLLLPWPDPLGDQSALVWFLLALVLELVAAVLGRRSLRSDPKGGAWGWLAIASLVISVTVLFLALCVVGLVLLYVAADDALG